MRFTLSAALLAAAGILVPAAATAAPSSLAWTPGLETQSPLTLVRDGEEYSGAYRRNYGGRYGYGPYYGYRGRPYGYRRYYGHRARPYGYRRYYAPGFGLGLGPSPYYYGPGFGIYVNP